MMIIFNKNKVKDNNMDNDNIKYIIKFFKNKEYADQFLNEKIIYANPVGFFGN